MHNQKANQDRLAAAVEAAKELAKAEADAYAAAQAKSAESYKRATDSDYRREQEKKEKDESRAAEKAARAYEDALKKANKGIRGKHIDAALEAQGAAFDELEALDNKLRAQDAQEAADKEYRDAVLATSKNTERIANSVDAALSPAEA